MLGKERDIKHRLRLQKLLDGLVLEALLVREVYTGGVELDIGRDQRSDAVLDARHRLAVGSAHRLKEKKQAWFNLNNTNDG